MTHHDIAIIGGGAAGLATAIFAARRATGASIAVLDGSPRPGAKILVSGGGRCNVTNAVVTPADYWGGSPNTIRRVLAALPVERTIAFFRELGVGLHEEADGKLFPDTNSARTVLDALLAETRRLGVNLLVEHRVHAVEPAASGFRLLTSGGELHALRLVLATGGMSLPKTGSDGTGYQIAQQLGHSLVPPVPALVPLVLDGAFHTPLSGISQEVALAVEIGGARPVRLAGAMLWTHFGVSGPAPMNASRHWHRARLEGRPVTIKVNLLPGQRFEAMESRLVALAGAQPKTSLQNALAGWLPARLATALLQDLGLSGQTPMAHLSREQRRRLIHGMMDRPLPIRDSRGYNHAEVTAGGVPLDEIDPAAMASRRQSGLFLVGEILDVDGRIGGFNFQWAWASACVAAQGLARSLTGRGTTGE